MASAILFCFPIFPNFSYFSYFRKKQTVHNSVNIGVIEPKKKLYVPFGMGHHRLQPKSVARDFARFREISQ